MHACTKHRSLGVVSAVEVVSVCRASVPWFLWLLSATISIAAAQTPIVQLGAPSTAASLPNSSANTGNIVQEKSAATSAPFPRELVEFVAEPADAVFAGAGSGNWDARIRERGWIVRENSSYRMWYTGIDPNSPLLKLGYATSPDGLIWTRYDNNPIYALNWIEDMMVVRHSGVYYMFAEGMLDQAQLLKSADGVSWERIGQIDVRKKNGEPIDPGPFGTPTAWVENGVWYFFFERRDLGIWLATSTDMKIWTNVQDEPVIELGPAGYDSAQVALNQIIKHGNYYYAYYHGAGALQAETGKRLWCTCIARSTDLIHWEKYEHNPLFPLEENKSSGIVVHDGQQYLLYTMHDQVRRHVPTRRK